MIQATEIHDYDGSSSRVMRFGSDVYSPLLPPSICNQSTAINPQDVILNRDTTFLASSMARNNKKQAPITDGTLMISPTGYIETVRTPYLNFNDIFFNTSPTGMMFSIDCPNSSSDSSICSNSSQSGLASPTKEFISLPPSSTILQSQLDNNSLDYFIKNNSFIENIKSSLTVEQQQYITSSMTALSTTYSCATTSPSKIRESYDLNTPDVSHDLNIYQPDLTAYEDIFGNDDKIKFSSSSSDSGTAISRISFDDDLESDSQMNLSLYGGGDKDEEAHEPYYVSTGRSETRLKSLLNILDDINSDTNISNVISALDHVRSEYISEITIAFIKIHQSPADDEFTVLCASVIKAYNSANRNVTKFSAYIGCTDVQKTPVINKKGKKINIKNPAKKYTKQTFTKKETNCSLQQEKRSRKNYDPKSINVLMDWYLKNNGKAPSGKSRQILSEKTGKSDVQISTWFQNARRRHQTKLEKFQSLSSKYPALIYSFQSFKAYLKTNKN
ncbi:hypothetical protein INT47_007372 [Mucor saturninus]|uniref:Homeobox domain-containing protein n=1 Tax=Mucor saturninus TaxID=64648 RepID=A0A8H7QXT2_9FUNG|nr:hypothetical protein INT47_007372 [Mucor saturninus]